MRVLILLLLFGSLMVSGASAAPAQCDDPENETIEELCGEIRELEGENERLRFELNQTGVFGTDLSERMREIGAWNPATSEPSLFIIRETGFFPAAYQYVGPGQGDTGFNGLSAWTRVANPQEARQNIDRAADDPESDREQLDVQPVEISIQWTTPELNGTTFTAASAGEYVGTLRDIEQTLNTPAALAQFSRFQTGRLADSQTVNLQIIWLSGVGVIGLLYGAVRIEAQKDWVKKRLNLTTQRTTNSQLASSVYQNSREQRIVNLVRQEIILIGIVILGAVGYLLISSGVIG